MTTTQPPSTPQPTNAAQPETHPSTVLVTPKGTPVVLPGPAPVQPLSPEMASLLTAALNTLPPGALPTLLRQNWQWLAALLVPLILTTYQNVKEIWSGPASLAAIKQEYADDHKEVEALNGQIDALQKKAAETEVKIDKVLWILNRTPGLPSSGPANF